MYIFEISKPGTWLEGIPDDQERWETESLIRLLINCIEDAAVSLASFEECMSNSSGDFERLMEQREADSERMRSISARLEAELPPNLAPQERFAAYDSIREFAAVQAKREAWSSGRIPDSYVHRRPFIHAKSFLYALDTLHKALKLLSKTPSAPAEVAEALAELDTAFPTLISVRDSAHHVEDRVQGKAWKRRIDLKPVENEAISAPSGGALIVDMLNDNRYGGTLADGTYGEVEVSAESVAIAQQSLQRVVESYSWSGPSDHLPR
jgi:hypothetical protein